MEGSKPILVNFLTPYCMYTLAIDNIIIYIHVIHIWDAREVCGKTAHIVQYENNLEIIFIFL
jgi:hypothetical protein